MKITLSHPHGNANSYHAALALSEQGWLCSFHTGVVRNAGASRWIRYLPASSRQRSLNRSYENIPEPDQSPHLIWEAVSRIGRRIKPAGLTARVNWYDVLFCGHDMQVSRALRNGQGAVYAYEDGAKATFMAAKRRGAMSVYELPLGYYMGVADELGRARGRQDGFPVTEEPEWKQARKKAELELADLVIVPCNWAKESLRFSSAARDKTVVTVPYGTPADHLPVRKARPSGPFTVLFAGQVGLRKGVPYLLEAWERLRLKDARLWLAGSLHPEQKYLPERSASFEYLGPVPRVRLLEIMREADLFVFPSLAEGFGMVIGEAMAVGLPVLTTVNTGGPELITHGREGWNVAARDVGALVEHMQWAYTHRDGLYEMGKLARQRAEQWTWADYRRKLIAELSPYLKQAAL